MSRLLYRWRYGRVVSELIYRARLEWLGIIASGGRNPKFLNPAAPAPIHRERTESAAPSIEDNESALSPLSELDEAHRPAKLRIDGLGNVWVWVDLPVQSFVPLEAQGLLNVSQARRAVNLSKLYKLGITLPYS
ncbi:hypothetical protein [Bradyrhizobium sp. Ai1a-2]|uniref:hypothetical protein n=1 Tax=Bradyrhizobium sp. Ai1a-2 TaxID=196490 RepID=UPI00047F3263|nr:hypothetical protein [Bradyrhizobium sp. Ai1a-2]